MPHRKNRKKPPTQDGRKLRRYRRRWKVECTFSWPPTFRRLVVRWGHSLSPTATPAIVAQLPVEIAPERPTFIQRHLWRYLSRFKWQWTAGGR